MDQSVIEKIGDAFYPTALENSFKRILNKIISLWGTEACESYFNDLMMDTRDGKRQGFPPDVANDIFILSRIHASQLTGVEDISNWGTEYAHEKSGDVPAYKRQYVDSKSSSLIKTIDSRSHEVVFMALKNGANPNERDARQRTPLMAAVYNNLVQVAEECIKYGADVNACDDLGYTSLHWASYNGSLHLVRALINFGANPNARSKSGWTPILLAASKGHLLAVAHLLMMGSEINSQCNEGWAPLHKAAANNHGSVVRLLLAKGANPKVSHSSFGTPEDVARRNGHIEIANALMHHSG